MSTQRVSLFDVARVRLSVLAHEESSLSVEATHTHTSVPLLSSDFLAAGTFFSLRTCRHFFSSRRFAPSPNVSGCAGPNWSLRCKPIRRILQLPSHRPQKAFFSSFASARRSLSHRVISSDSVVISNVTRRALFWSAPIAHLLCRC